MYTVNMKSFSLIAVTILLVGGAVFAVAIWLDRGNAVPYTEIDLSRNALINPPQTPIANTPIALSAARVISPFLMPDGVSVRYYLPDTGQIYEITPSAPKNQTLVAKLKPGAMKIVWSRDGSIAIASYTDGLIRYDLAKNTSAPVNEKIFDPVFSPYSDDIAYVYFDEDTGEGNISVADGAFSAYKNLMKTRLQNWRIQWISKTMLAMSAISPENQLHNLFTLDTETKKLTPVLENQKEFKALWSPDGNTLLFSRVKSKATQLLWMRSGDAAAQIIPLETPASRCAWARPNDQQVGRASVTVIYCASESKLVRIRIGDTADPIQVASITDAEDILISPDQRTAIYRNYRDGRIYAIHLTKIP